MVELVFGTVQLGVAYGRANAVGKPSHEDALALVNLALRGGVRCFDTARAYGDSEARLGDALMGKTARVITKLSPLANINADATPDEVRMAVDQSLSQSHAALRQDRLDVLLLHRTAHLHAFGGAIWGRLKERQAQGFIGTLGVSVGSVEEARRALADAGVRHIQLPANLLDWRWQEAGIIQVLKSSGVTVHIRSVLLQGILAADPAVWPNCEGIDAPVVARWLAQVAEDLKRDSVADLAMAYIRAQDWVDGAVLGMQTQEQLRTNLKLFGNPPLTRKECVFIEQTRPHLPSRFLDPAQWPKT